MALLPLVPSSRHCFVSLSPPSSITTTFSSSSSSSSSSNIHVRSFSSTTTTAVHSISRPTTVYYNHLIRFHTNSSLHTTAIELFLQMLDHHHLIPNEHTYPFLLKSVSALGFLHLARQLHARLLKLRYLQGNIFSATALLDVYGKWGSLDDARKLFDGIPDRNVAAWNSLISCYVQNGFLEEAKWMLGSLELEIGCEVRHSTWNSVIAGCVRRGDAENAFDVLGSMAREIRPNPSTFNTLIPLIPDVGCMVRLKEFHGYALRHADLINMDAVGVDRLQTAIASGYANNRCMAYALRLFDVVDVKTLQLWIAVIAGLIDTGNTHEGFEFFRDMVRKHGQEQRPLSKISLTLVLPECDPRTRHGPEIHAYAYRHGLESYTSVSNALIAMYTKRGNATLADQVFLLTDEKDVITWNAIVSSYAVVQDFHRAFVLFREMLLEGVKADEFSFGSVLNGCGHSSSVLQGMALHCLIIKGGFSKSCVVQNALIDTYGKCGFIAEARRVFDSNTYKDMVSWNTMISCYAFNSCPQSAFSLLNKMEEEGWRPNRVTFVGLLSACSHAGMLNKGLEYFNSMPEYGITPDINHYTCIVDGLCRAGQLEEAYQLILSMPVEANDCIWGALLNGCRIHGNLELAEVAATHLNELEPGHAGYRVLLSNIYGDASQWSDKSRVRAAMKDDGVKKTSGYSWIELGNGLNGYFTADRTKEKSSYDVYIMLDSLTKQMRDEGYNPSTNPRYFYFEEVS